MAQAEVDWRSLKKELFMSPLRPRTSKTFQHSDIFNSKSSNTNNSTIVKEGRSEVAFLTPSRIRETDNTRSHVLDKSDIKTELPSKPPGKKTFESKSTIFRDLPVKKRTPNPHRIPDHKGEWFYEQSDEPRRALSKAKLSTTPGRTKPEVEGLSPHRQRKQEELYKSEIGTQHYLSPDGNNLNLVPRSRSEINITAREYQTERSYNPTERKNEQHQSHIFESQGYKLDYSNFKTVADNESEDKPLDNPEANRIKRLNHNFSNVFGLEYGAKESLNAKKQEGRDLSTQLQWTNVDTILNSKDMGKKNKPVTQTLKQRSRVLDQKSTMDTHNGYDNVNPKVVRTNIQKNLTIQRGVVKTGK